VFATTAIPVGDRAAGRFRAAAPFSQDLRGLLGFANAPRGADGVIRHMRPVLPAADGGYLPSFAVATLAAYERHSAKALQRALADRGGRLTLPLGEPSRGVARSEEISVATLADTVWRIDFAGPPDSFAAFPAGPLIRLARSGVRPDTDNPFRGRIVLVGATFEATGDVYPTPVGLMRGVEIQANALHTLLARRALLPPHWAVNLGLMIAVCLWVTLLSLRLSGVWVAALTAVFVAVLILVSYEAYSRGYWLDFVAPVTAMLLYRVGAGWLARRRLRRAFGEFISPDILAQVLRDGARLGSGEVRSVSVLMSDVRGFTALAERRAPDEVSQTMNDYFSAMVDVVMRHHGMVQDFIGDGILAVYGAPADDPEHAWHAVRSAVDMQAALRDLNARWAAEGRPTLAIGIAVNTGHAFAGMMGAPRKKKYSVIGDVVNTVARIEAQTRDLGTGILVSGSTLEVVRSRVVVKDRGAVHVKGKTQAIDLFELVDVATA
jgi:adenylate cyclase